MTCISSIEQCFDHNTGPLYFCENFLKIPHIIHGVESFNPYTYQKNYINAISSQRYTVALIPRQFGKTLCSLAYVYWYALFNPNSKILVATHSNNSAMSSIDKIKFFHKQLTEQIGIKVSSCNKHSIDFENGSTIIANTVSENLGRGMTLDLIFCDEFAFAKKASEFWQNAYPAFHNAKIIIASTYNTNKDMFFSLFLDAVKSFSFVPQPNQFIPFAVHWNEHPKRDLKWAIDQRELLGTEMFHREYCII